VTDDLPTDLAAEDELTKLKKAFKDYAERPGTKVGEYVPIVIEALVTGNPGVKEFRVTAGG
jgi:hypothetical protein